MSKNKWENLFVQIQLIPQSSMAAISSTIKQLQEEFIPSSMSLENAKNISEGRKKRLYNKSKRTGLDVDWFRFKDTAARSRKTCEKIYNNFISSSVASNSKSDSTVF